MNYRVQFELLLSFYTQEKLPKLSFYFKIILFLNDSTVQYVTILWNSFNIVVPGHEMNFKNVNKID